MKKLNYRELLKKAQEKNSQDVYKQIFIDFCADKIVDLPHINIKYSDKKGMAEVVYTTSYMNNPEAYCVISDELGIMEDVLVLVNPKTEEVIGDFHGMVDIYSPIMDFDFIKISNKFYNFLIKNWDKLDIEDNIKLKINIEEQKEKIEQELKLPTGFKYETRECNGGLSVKIYSTDTETYAETTTMNKDGEYVQEFFDIDGLWNVSLYNEKNYVKPIYVEGWQNAMKLIQGESIDKIDEIKEENKQLKEDVNEVTNTLELNTGVLPIVYTGLYSLNEEISDYNITNDELDSLLIEIAEPIIIDTITEVLPSVKIESTGVYHPKYYNFEDDELEFKLTYNVDEFNKLKEDALANDDFAKFLADKYSSYDGFISTLANDVRDFEDQKDWKQFVQVIMFNINSTTITDNDEKFTNEFLENLEANYPELTYTDIIDAAAKDGIDFLKLTVNNYKNLSMTGEIIDNKLVVNVVDFDDETGETNEIGEYTFDIPEEIETEDDIKDYLNESKNQVKEDTDNLVYKVYAIDQNHNEYTSRLVDTVNSVDQAESKVAEIRTQGQNAYFVSDTKKEKKKGLNESLDLNELEQLALDLDNFMFDYDTYDYKDQYDTREDGYNDVIKSLSSDKSIKGVINTLQEIIDNDKEEDNIENAKKLLARVKDIKNIK